MTTFGEPTWGNGNTPFNNYANNPNWWQWQYRPQPCPTCHRCPTCGSYSPANTWTVTTTGTGTVSGASLYATSDVADTCPSAADDECEHD